MKGSIVLFRKEGPPVVGLDISSSAVKLLELGRAGAKYRVESYAVEPLPPNSVVEKNISDPAAVGEAIRRAVKRSGTRAKHAAMCVSGSSAIVKVITMPSGLSEDEMESQIQLEADQHVPFPLEEVSLDFDVLGPVENEEGSVQVLIAACRSENVDGRVTAAELGGLTAKIIDVENFAVERSFSLMESQIGSGDEEERTVAIADIGSTVTTLNVIHGDSIIFTKEQIFGGKQLTEEIQRRYGLSYEEAGMAKRQGGLPDNYYPEVLEPFKESMVNQVSRSLQFFSATSHHTEVDLIILAGGSASIPGVDELVQEKLGITTIVANPFANMALASRVKAAALSNDAPSLLISCGLALRSFG